MVPSESRHTRSYEKVYEVIMEPSFWPNASLVTHGTPKQYACSLRLAGKPDDDVVAPWSNRGGAARRPDLVAPGQSVVGLRDPGSRLDREHPQARVIHDQGRLGGIFPRLRRGEQPRLTWCEAELMRSAGQWEARSHPDALHGQEARGFVRIRERHDRGGGTRRRGPSGHARHPIGEDERQGEGDRPRDPER